MNAPAPTTAEKGRFAAAPTQDMLLGDCWFVEVMPPTWAWAYRRLLDAGEPPEHRFTRRLA